MPTASSNVRFQGQLGKHSLAQSFSQFDICDIGRHQQAASHPFCASEHSLSSTVRVPSIRWHFGAIAASLACPMRFNFWTQICPPTQFILRAPAWGRVRLSVFLQQIELTSMRLHLLKEALPSFEAAMMFWDSPSEYQWQVTSSIAAPFGLRLAGVELMKQPYDYEAALASVPPDHRKTLIIPIAPAFYRDRERLAEFCVQHRIASMFAVREFADAGGLLSYGPDFPAIFRRVADYVDRIAKGAKAADLPVEQPTKFELVINLKTAKVLSIDIPDKLTALADEVIEQAVRQQPLMARLRSADRR
jgi:hypothetical protein